MSIHVELLRVTAPPRRFVHEVLLVGRITGDSLWRRGKQLGKHGTRSTRKKVKSESPRHEETRCSVNELAGGDHRRRLLRRAQPTERELEDQAAAETNQRRQQHLRLAMRLGSGATAIDGWRRCEQYSSEARAARELGSTKSARLPPEGTAVRSLVIGRAKSGGDGDRAGRRRRLCRAGEDGRTSNRERRRKIINW